MVAVPLGRCIGSQVRDTPGRKVTVAVLLDKQKKTVVNNESSDILRMLNKEFNAFCVTEEQGKIDLYPDPVQEKIDELNGWIYP